METHRNPADLELPCYIEPHDASKPHTFLVPCRRQASPYFPGLPVFPIAPDYTDPDGYVNTETN